MDPSTRPSSAADSTAEQRTKAAESRISALSSLLETIEDSRREVPSTDRQPQTTDNRAQRHEQRLIQARLGVASSLFVALRAKHSATASHSLRVALAVSSWAIEADFTEPQCDAVEVAALLHDVGKIGVPDHVLLKPGKLAGEELLMMERHRQLGAEILSGCCLSSDVLDIVTYAPGWYDGSRHGFDRIGQDLPLGSRMMAIVDAFDAMTTDHVYRRALSRERAVAELFEYSGSQFDPKLVKRFCSLVSSDKIQFTRSVSRRWLQQIQEDASNSLWGYGTTASTGAPDSPNVAFHTRLLESMHDGVIFVDDNFRITMWNRAAERLSGIAPGSVIGTCWTPSLIGMSDERGNQLEDEECPIAHTIRSGTQTLRRISLSGRGGDRISADIHIAPVLHDDGVARGATIVLHDASSQITLEQRVQSLHKKATLDPLTKLANRAEFDRLLPEFVKTHLEEGVPCSMIICDIDHFKRINDTYGHQAGDEALTFFASILQRHARSGDLVARYGGEEFVILCADCDNATATRRAEDLRRNVAQQSQPSLGNRCITASFGVTETQGGDTAETFLKRADRALLQAKDNGRNLVVQLGTGIAEDIKPGKGVRWFNWFSASPAEELLSRDLITVVPLKVAAEKMRGFVADHEAQILAVDENRVSLRIDGQNTPLTRRRSDRPVPFLIELTFEDNTSGEESDKGHSQTLIRVVVRPKRPRDRRRGDVIERARQLLVSLKSYLMAHDYTDGETRFEDGANREEFLNTTERILRHWLTFSG